jgi:hypothetical protein
MLESIFERHGIRNYSLGFIVHDVTVVQIWKLLVDLWLLNLLKEYKNMTVSS